jgi:hypothetical protein
MPDKDKATQIVEAILADLTRRRGLRQEWDGIDKDIQREIRDTWADAVRQILDGTTKTQGYEPNQTPMSVSEAWKSDGTGFRD